MECLRRDTALIDQGLTHPGATSELDLPTHIGPYRILRVLGEGGMGVVYLAEQAEPFRRQVALKVLKIGMNTREVVARFEAERQALALMSHSHIAQIFGAGATEDGRPYFVMEHVAGMPITDYCDQNELSTRERLELFIQVCSAVEHAHQKGVIHRDIKPQNILVTVQDGRPAPKVIDFGVAKATHQRLTEKTVFTHLGLIIGTPEYMSPEQAELGGVEITHATDIYSLGVVLYELLVSALPFDPTALRRAGYAEIQRIIREEEPVPPSTRLTDLGEKAVDIAQHRRTDLSTLARQLKGDLDWIALKAIEKEPAKRYPSAAALAADVSRHLGSDRVLARRSSLRARIRRFTRRHPLRSRIIAAAAAIVLIMGAASAWTWVMSRGVPLTIVKPVGGTIIGGGLVCGTRGAVCSTTRPAAEAVEFFAVPDPDFVFGGFAGECAPTGRVLMSGPRTCGGTFTKTEPIGPQISRRLAIDKPTGGTLVSAAGILCGTLGTLCAANLPDGSPVALKAVADTGRQLSQFTGACAGSGETVLTADRACGAIFTRVEDRSRASRQPTEPVQVTPPATTTVSADPAAGAFPVITPEDHARREIETLVNQYCAAMQTLESAQIKRLFPSVAEPALVEQFRYYESLKCSLTTPITFVRLNPSPTGGFAEIVYGMKQEMTLKTGQGPATSETVVRMLLSKREPSAPWVIERVTHTPKPKG